MKTKVQRAVVLPLLLILAVCVQAFGLHSYVAPRHPRRAAVRRTHVRKLAWNPVFRPSRDSLLRQNEEIDRLDLPRIQDDAELEQLKTREELVPIVAGRLWPISACGSGISFAYGVRM